MSLYEKTKATFSIFKKLFNIFVNYYIILIGTWLLSK